MFALPHLVLLLTSFLLGLLTSATLRNPRPTPAAQPSDPTYKPRRPQSCKPPSNFRHHTLHYPPSCIRLLTLTDATLTANITLPTLTSHALHLHLHPSIHPSIRSASASVTANASRSFRYKAGSLTPDTEYTLVLTNDASRTICRTSFTTLPTRWNAVRNPGLEEEGPSPHKALRTGAVCTRSWTGFYNGGCRRICGVIREQGGAYHYPRSGRCCLQLGFRPGDREPVVQRFYGAYQSVRVAIAAGGIFYVTASYSISDDLGDLRDDAESGRDALAMVVGFRQMDGGLDDGVVVPLDDSCVGWRTVCVRVSAPVAVNMVHIYFHLHDYERGSVLVDDVSLFMEAGNNMEELKDVCYEDKGSVSERVERQDVRIDLKAGVEAVGKQMTIAVPLTADRVLRLETLSRQYGGGPICAAVLVRSREEAEEFRAIWSRKLWLRQHVSVRFFRLQGPIPLNALRNRAVEAVTTEFVVMLDVDMTPNWKLDCMRDEKGEYLSALDHAFVLALPVFITDVHRRAAEDKQQLMNQLKRRVATWYCVASQKSHRPGRWYRDLVGETRVTEAYEPYGIVRRKEFVEFDERFVGYGFNKISWAVHLESLGIRILVASHPFLTHLNHVEHGWVADICVDKYVQTWRRFAAFVGEKGDVFAEHFLL